jgi:hypothetical protein
MKVGTFTNRVFDIFGIVIFKKVIGVVKSSTIPHIVKRGEWVIFPLYRGKKIQFHSK